MQKKLWYNVLVWAGLYGLWIIVFQQRAFSFSRTMTVQFCYLLFIAANYYFNTWYTIPRLLYRRKYVLFGLMASAGIILAAALRVPVATYLSVHYFAPGKTPPASSVLFFDSLVNIAVWVICMVAVKLIADRIRFQRYIDLVEKEKVRNELDFLKAQFNPHFLFNSINSIYGNINKTNTTARNMLLTFSDMLRYQLYECNMSMISIEREIDYIQNYISLQQIRRPENLSVQLLVGDEVKGIDIAPLIFIAFIENSFKYVSNHEDRQNEVRISMERNEQFLHFTAFNTKDTNGVSGTVGHKGIGIANVRRRLELLYPGRHELSIQSGDESYEVSLNLQV